MADESPYLAPPAPLLKRNPLLWLQFFGPGAVIASLTVGSGELLFPSRLGAIFGLRLLWIFPLVALLKWVLAYTSMRHMILTGAHPIERWHRFPGPRGWLPLFFISIVVICAPFWASFQTGLLGSICASIFPVGDLYEWATACVLLSFVLLTIGGYAFLERAQMLILAVMLASILVATFYVQPEWWKILQGLVVPQFPAYPNWVLTKYAQDFAGRSEWIELAVAISVTGGAAADYACYAGFLREKKWGRSGMAIAEPDEVERISADPQHPARVWVRAALIDTVLSMVMIVVIAVCFSTLGAMILQSQQLIPAKDTELLVHQGQFLTLLSPLLLPLYQLAVFLAFFGNVYGGPEITNRVCYEFARSRGWEQIAPQQIRRFAIAWTLLGGLSVVWLKRAFPDVGLVDIVTFPAIYASILMCGIYCLLNPWTDWRFLPARLRMHRLLVALNVCAGVIFFVIGINAMWEQTLWHFLILPCWIGGSMLLAGCARWLRTDSVT